MKLRDVNTKNKVMISGEKIPFLNIHPISTPPLTTHYNYPKFLKG